MYTIDLFKARFPEFSAIGDGVVQPIIDEANLFLDETQWTDWFLLGAGYYVAHIVYIGKTQTAGDGGASLPMTGMKTGGLMLQFHSLENSRASEAFFQSTSYGQQYLRLSRIVGSGAVVI